MALVSNFVALLLVPGVSEAPEPYADRPAFLESVTIVGSRDAVDDTAGAAHFLNSDDLERLHYTDIQRIIREVPGVSIQIEDGYGLRPNLGIRGTATERSSRITLLEDNVLIAPAPYSAPSAYYFPTMGRMAGVEVLKGPSSIVQGPYTVGGAINFLSTPIPDEYSGAATLEAGSDATYRVKASYGGASEQFGWLVETHQWRSDGYQDIDFSDRDTGLEKEDWTVKLRWNSKPQATVYQELNLKLQYAREDSEQSYLGLTDSDFQADPLRRYLASESDLMDNEHDQIILSYSADWGNRKLTAAAYNNNHKRNWFKTEGFDPDGSANAQEFGRVSWFNVVQAINTGQPIGDFSAQQLQAVLDGADTAPGSIQLRSNDREYYSRGIQAGFDWTLDSGSVQHDLSFGVRYHEDEEDRLQRNSSYHQEAQTLVLDDRGLLGNAGNRVQQAEAWAFFVQDTITVGAWTLTPGVRHERIDQRRIRWETRNGRTDDPSARTQDNFRSSRRNETNVWIPGLGALYEVSPQLSLLAGVHKGFTAPSNAPDVDEEESINYELGFRYANEGFRSDVVGFYTDYDNLLGICTASSGTDCEVGDAFNGDAASVLGLEVQLSQSFEVGRFEMPLQLTYTWLDAEFDSDIADTDFFGSVSKGDPLPYIPDHQLALSMGLQAQSWRAAVAVNYVDEVCVRAACGDFEATDDGWFIDLTAEYEIRSAVTLYGSIENLFDEDAILGRQPYGARPNKDRSALVGVKFAF